MKTSAEPSFIVRVNNLLTILVCVHYAPMFIPDRPQGFTQQPALSVPNARFKWVNDTLEWPGACAKYTATLPLTRAETV